jgi:hypothetical protein
MASFTTIDVGVDGWLLWNNVVIRASQKSCSVNLVFQDFIYMKLCNNVYHCSLMPPKADLICTSLSCTRVVG